MGFQQNWCGLANLGYNGRWYISWRLEVRSQALNGTYVCGPCPPSMTKESITHAGNCVFHTHPLFNYESLYILCWNSCDASTKKTMENYPPYTLPTSTTGYCFPHYRGWLMWITRDTPRWWVRDLESFGNFLISI